MISITTPQVSSVKLVNRKEKKEKKRNKGVSHRVPRTALDVQRKIKLESKSLLSMMTKVEHKEIVPTFKGTDSPTEMRLPHLGYICVDSKESLLMVGAMRSLFGNKHYRFTISTALNMSSSGAGIANSTISNSVLVSAPDFVSLATVFNEYFVIGFHLHWMPVSRYQYPLGGTSTLSVANLPLGCADLQHGQGAYSSLSTMTDNFRFKYHNTGDPFLYSWLNTESISETVMASETAPTQSWCPVNNASNYQGTVQFLTQSAPPALPFSQVLGTFHAAFDVMFRVRI